MPSITVKVEKVLEFSLLRVEAEVRYWEDATINGFEDKCGTLVPCRIGDLWSPVIDIDSGTILNWSAGTVAKIHYKVCDCGKYTLTDDEGNEVLSIEGYVPNCMCPNESGYGDYIIMDVDGFGKIDGWEWCDRGFIESDG